ncbi:GNAT family N-acetyltransferase [Oceanirhabdus sp. W0125-5]|uniref:GNAT family N-acetyltransferase n=1 Tax=Oceanirhabdus sp. W0125-5 TaxID=2999116 RepID=UPI0022F32650|nr:GNAT family N-acetyltransferase [Oceanirhabdus sp. W0125-5]WBW95891.1 GNAT family N-acetyltransferase [Oceanirhabdus sp. W0125-5]
MGEYLVTSLSEDYAKEICRWKYPGDYSVYNYPDWSVVVANNFGISFKETRDSEFVAILVNNKFIAYGRIRLSKGKSFIGIGLTPSYCGKGIGGSIMKLLIQESKNRFPNCTIALQVRSFNKRAIKCYKSAGFKIIDKYIANALNGKDEFIYMEYIESNSKDN